MGRNINLNFLFKVLIFYICGVDYVLDLQKDIIEPSKKGLVVVDFYANWCMPCKKLGPILEKLEKEYKFKLIKVNTESEQELSAEFGIMSIPAIFFFKAGEPVENFVGAYPEVEIRKMLEKHK